MRGPALISGDRKTSARCQIDVEFRPILRRGRYAAEILGAYGSMRYMPWADAPKFPVARVQGCPTCLGNGRAGMQQTRRDATDAPGCNRRAGMQQTHRVVRSLRCVELFDQFLSVFRFQRTLGRVTQLVDLLFHRCDSFFGDGLGVSFSG